MPIARVRVKGDKELQRRLQSLPKKVSGKIGRTALKDGATVIRDSVRTGAPTKSGKVKRAVKVKAGKRSRKGPRYNVQIGDGDFKGETFYAAFVELGHRVGPRRFGNQRRKVTPDPFMKQAARMAGPKATKVIGARLKLELERAGA